MKLNSRIKLPKFQSIHFFKNACRSKSTNIIRSVLALLFVMAINQISYSQTNSISNIISQQEAYSNSGNNPVLSLRSCQETDKNTAYFDIKNESNCDVKPTSIF